MAKHADHAIPDTSEEWLDWFNTFSIYQVLPQLIELWGLNVKTEVESKKARPTEREMMIVSMQSLQRRKISIDFN